MRNIVILTFVVTLFSPFAAEAKRMGPAKVEPVVYEGVRYTAPNDDGKRGYIHAEDAKTGKALYDIEVFKTKIDPGLEEDIQWVFITGMKMEGGSLMVVNDEKGNIYAVDLKTRKVVQPPTVRG